MPGLRRLRDPLRRPGLLPRAGHAAGADRLHHRHRLRRPLRVLHGHVRDAHDPRARAGARDRAGRRAARPLGLDRDRRRRRAVDRRQPPDPRAASQRADEDPALQQPDLRLDEGPGVADERARQDHEVDAVRLDRPSVQPDLAGARRGGDLRRAHARHATSSTCPTIAARGRRAPGLGARRDLPELPGLQRRRVRGADARRRPATTARSRSCTGSRSASAPTASTASPAGRTAACGSSRWPTSARTRCSSTTRTGRTRASPSSSRGWPTRPRSRRRSGSSAQVQRPVWGDSLSGELAAARDRTGTAELDALLREGDTWTVA